MKRRVPVRRAQPSVKRLVSAAISDRGVQLRGELRDRIEDCFGTRLNHVRLHSSPESHVANESFRSLAFAVDGHICFRQRIDELPRPAFTPILAHEMAHVLQKTLAANERRCIPASNCRLEREANAAMQQVCRGERVTALTADPWSGPRRWGPEGHYYTILWASLAAGLPLKAAVYNAFFAQMPDQVAQLDAIPVVGLEIWHYGRSFPSTFEAGVLAGLRSVPLVGSYVKANPWMEQYWQAGANQQIDEMVVQWQVQTGLHALTGEDAESESRKRMARLEVLEPGTFEFALALHPFGDTFAHRASGSYTNTLYPAPFGHLFKGTHADRIDLRKDLYKRYGRALFDLFVKKWQTSPPGAARMTFEKELDLVCTEPECGDQIQFLLNFAGAAYAHQTGASRPESQKILSEVYRPEKSPTHAGGFCSQTWAEFYAENHNRTDVPVTGDLLDKALKCASDWGTGMPVAAPPEIMDFLKDWGETEARMAATGAAI